MTKPVALSDACKGATRPTRTTSQRKLLRNPHEADAFIEIFLGFGTHLLYLVVGCFFFFLQPIPIMLSVNMVREDPILYI